MSNGLKVKKRNGRGTESLDLDKIHKMVEEACKGLAGVSASQVEIQSGIQFYDGITTAEIHEILIKSASDLISESNPNYQYVAARLLNMQLRKEVWGCGDHPIDFLLFLQRNIDNGIYDQGILDKWNEEDIDKLGDEYESVLMKSILENNLAFA